MKVCGGFDLEHAEHGVVAPALERGQRVGEQGGRLIGGEAHAGVVGAHERLLRQRLIQVFEARGGEMAGGLRHGGLHEAHAERGRQHEEERQDLGQRQVQAAWIGVADVL